MPDDLGLNITANDITTNRVPTNASGDQFASDLKDDAMGGAMASINKLNWNVQFPFQLLVLKTSTNEDGEPTYTMDEEWQYVLPIPPEDINISTPFAINTMITQGGVVEQHNGAPIRMINFSGSFGVYSLRGSADGLKQTGVVTGVVDSIFAGTIQNTTRTVNSTVAVATGSRLQSPNLYQDSDINEKATGYYHFRMLNVFLECYAQLKKTDEGKNYRLALAIFKDQAAYLVTPVQYDVKWNKESPYERRYTLSLKAWKRINSDSLETVSNVYGNQKKRSPNLVARALVAIENARDALNEARQTALSVKPDLDATIGEALRQSALFCKDAINVVLTVGDVGSEIASGDMYHSILRADFDSVIAKATQSSDVAIQTDARHVASDMRSFRSGITPKNSQAQNIFLNPQNHYKFFKTLKPSGLPLSASSKKKIKKDIATVRQLTRSDFEAKRNKILDFAADYADLVGASDSAYNTTYGRANTIKAIRQPTDEDYRILAALNEAVMGLNHLSAYTNITPNNQFVTAIDAVAGLAQRSGIAFQRPTSKFAVPVPYGSTLEQLANQYLGDATRWMEIAQLNGLQEPYIDEIGFDLPLLVNGNENTVVVSDASSLYVGQLVYVFAPTVGQTVRHIVQINKVTNSYYAVILDGDPNLSVYTTGSGAKLHAYLPGTTNSQQQIYIPSTSPASNDLESKSVPGTNDYDHLLKVGGIDWLLTPDGDIAVTQDGNVKLSFGLTNLVQRAKIALSTVRGTLLLHPDFGLNVRVGDSLANMSAKEILSSTKGMFSGNSGFTGVNSASVNLTSGAAEISLSLGISGYSRNIPISFQVPKT